MNRSSGSRAGRHVACSEIPAVRALLRVDRAEVEARDRPAPAGSAARSFASDRARRTACSARASHGARTCLDTDDGLQLLCDGDGSRVNLEGTPFRYSSASTSSTRTRHPDASFDERRLGDVYRAVHRRAGSTPFDRSRGQGLRSEFNSCATQLGHRQSSSKARQGSMQLRDLGRPALGDTKSSGASPTSSHDVCEKPVAEPVRRRRSAVGAGQSFDLLRQRRQTSRAWRSWSAAYRRGADDTCRRRDRAPRRADRQQDVPGLAAAMEGLWRSRPITSGIAPARCSRTTRASPLAPYDANNPHQPSAGCGISNARDEAWTSLRTSTCGRCDQGLDLQLGRRPFFVPHRLDNSLDLSRCTIGAGPQHRLSQQELP